MNAFKRQHRMSGFEVADDWKHEKKEIVDKMSSYKCKEPSSEVWSDFDATREPTQAISFQDGVEGEKTPASAPAMMGEQETPIAFALAQKSKNPIGLLISGKVST